MSIEEEIQKILEENNGNVSKTANIMGISHQK